MYHLLLTSLPALPRHFEQPVQPISRLKLTTRLRMVEPGDKEILQLFIQFLDGNKDEEIFVKDYDLLQSLLTGSASSVLLDIADIQMISGALRARIGGQQAPRAIGRFGDYIRRNFPEADFGLGRRFPWLHDLDLLLQQNDSQGAMRKISRQRWQVATQNIQEHGFDLEAMMLYLVRWHTLSVWALRNPDTGRTIFTTFIEETIHDSQ